MSKVRTFSTPNDWDCLDKLLEKLPRSMDASKTVKKAVEDMLEKVNKTPYVSLDNFETEITVPDLTMDKKVWKKLLREMSTPDVRELHKLLAQRQQLVDDEIYRSTL